MIGGTKAINSREVTKCQYVIVGDKVYMECHRIDGDTFGHWTNLTKKDSEKYGYDTKITVKEKS